MPRRSARQLLAALLVLAVATLAAFGPARPAMAATGPITLDPGFLYLNVAPGGTAEATFQVTAADGEFVSASVNASWLALDKAWWQGSRTVRVTAAATGMAEGEMRVARIYLTGYPREVALPVVLAVNGPAAPPPAVAYPAGVDFGTLTPQKYATFYTNLALAAPAEVRISADADWIDVQPKSLSGVTTALITVRPVPQRTASPGAYTGTITVQAGSAPPLRIPVTLQVASPDSSQAGPSAAEAEAPFDDVPPGHWARGAIAELAAAGVINGVGNGRFAPDETVTREQFAKLLVMAFGLSHNPDPSPYPDVAADRWSAAYIVAAGPFMARYQDGLFHPELAATREEIAVALTRIKGLAPAKNPDLWMWFTDYKEILPAAAGWVATARAVGLIDGFPDRTFRPREPVTRAQAAVLLQRAQQICGQAPEAGCAAPLSKADQTLAGATLAGARAAAEATIGPAQGERPGYINAYTSVYRGGQVTVDYVTPANVVWSVRLQGKGATPRGIKIGDSLEAVWKAYGPDGKLENGVLTYSAGAELSYFYIQFLIVDGKVHTIFLSQSK